MIATATTSRTSSDNPQLSVAKTPSKEERIALFKAQFRYFYGQASGYFAIDEGIRDDEAPTGIQMLLPTEERPDTPNGRVWCYYDVERPDLLEAAAAIALEKAERSGNVYLTRTLFERKRATKDSTKPSRIIAVEDAPPELPIPASRAIRTSPGSRQAVYRLAEPVSTAKAERLSRLIARVVGSDRSGTNANKVLRLVGGLNTKKKCGAPFLVRVESRGPDYTYDELWSAYSSFLPTDEVEALESQKDCAAVRWPEAKEQWVEHWRKHISELMVDGMPRVFKLATWSQGHKIFGDEAYIAGWRHESGSWDASTVRHVRAANLVRAGVTDEMAAAMLEAAEKPETIRIKGLNAVRNDIRQVVTMARESETDRQGRGGYELVGSWARKRQPEYALRAEGQHEEPRVGGRPVSLTAEALLAFYHERASSGIVTMTRAEVAEALHVSPATIYRLNSELKTRREITVEHTPDRQRSLIRLARLVKTPIADEPAVRRSDEATERVEMPQTALDASQCISVTHLGLSPRLGPARDSAPAEPEKFSDLEAAGAAAEESKQNLRSSQSTLQPQAAPRPRAQLLDSLVVEALEQCAADERVSTATGEIAAGRASWARVLEAINAGPLRFAEPVIRARYDYWVKRRRWLRQIAKLRQDAPHYPNKKLYGLARWCDKLLATGETEPRYWVAARYYDVLEPIIEHRRTLRAVVQQKANSRRPEKPQPPMLEALAHVDEPPASVALNTEAPQQGAPEPGSAGYSVDCVEYASGRLSWRLWDDALDLVIAEFGTQAAAEWYVNNGFVELHREVRAERAAEELRTIQPWRAPKTTLAA